MGWEDRDDLDDGGGEEAEFEYREGLVFVGMCFNGAENDERFAVIRDVCEELELEAVRADMVVGSTCITDDAKALIDEAEFVIFEISGDRPSVYHEIGYAESGHPLEDTLILAAKSTVPAFNIQSRRIHFYGTLKEMRRLLRQQLEAMIALHDAGDEDDED